MILPILDAPQDWRDEERDNHAAAIALMEDLDLRYFDLHDTMVEAIEQGINPREGGQDNWHPSVEVAERFAHYLHERGLITAGQL